MIKPLRKPMKINRTTITMATASRRFTINPLIAWLTASV